MKTTNASPNGIFPSILKTKKKLRFAIGEHKQFPFYFGETEDVQVSRIRGEESNDVSITL